jgi:hypothetical protein
MSNQATKKDASLDLGYSTPKSRDLSREPLKGGLEFDLLNHSRSLRNIFKNDAATVRSEDELEELVINSETVDPLCILKKAFS